MEQAPPSSVGAVDRAVSELLCVTEDNIGALIRYAPTVEIGHQFWLAVESSLGGKIQQGYAHDSTPGDGVFTEVAQVGARSVMRLLQDLPELVNDKLRFLTLDEKAAPRPKSARTGQPAAACVKPPDSSTFSLLRSR